MGQINISGVNKAVSEYIKSNAGKNKVEQYIEDCSRKNMSKTPSGASIVTEKEMKEAAQLLINMFKDYAAKSGLPESVADDVADISVTRDDSKNGVICIGFSEENIKRPSLYNIRKDNAIVHTGEGIDNIISLFDTGYTVTKTDKLYGRWRGHEELGVIKALLHREGAGFVSRIVNEFNALYGQRYNCVASIVADARFYKR